VGVRDGEEVRLLEGLADELQSDRQSVRRETAGNVDGRQPREVHADRVDVAQVHRERIGFFPDLERGNRRRGRDERVDFLVRVQEVLTNQRADFLCTQVVGVV